MFLIFAYFLLSLKSYYRNPSVNQKKALSSALSSVVQLNRKQASGESATLKLEFDVIKGLDRAQTCLETEQFKEPKVVLKN